MSEDLQYFVEGQYHATKHASIMTKNASMFLDDARLIKYTWDFATLLQKRWQFEDGEWKIVKTRSIRRVQVLDKPSMPCG